MTPSRTRPLRDVLEMHRDAWDCDDTRSSVREAFAKVVDCGTEALGAEVFASDSEEPRRFVAKLRARPLLEARVVITTAPGEEAKSMTARARWSATRTPASTAVPGSSS